MNRSRGLILFGSNPASSSAKTAPPIISTTSPIPSAPKGSRNTRRRARQRRLMRSETAADTGIHGSDDEVGDHVDQDEENGGDQYGAGHQRIIPGQDRVIDQFADPGPGEDDLGEEVAAWFDRYVELYGEKPVVAAVEGYRGADVLVKALEIAGRDLTVDGLIEAMESITDYRDIFGYRLTFGPNDHKGVGESLLSVVENGRWVTKAESVTY